MEVSRHLVRQKRSEFDRVVCRLAQWLIGVVILSGLGGLLVGCANDPYSQRRIARRQQHLRQTIQALAEHEASAAGRRKAFEQRLHRWWQLDNERFQQRMRTAGDDFW